MSYTNAYNYHFGPKDLREWLLKALKPLVAYMKRCMNVDEGRYLCMLKK